MSHRRDVLLEATTAGNELYHADHFRRLACPKSAFGCLSELEDGERRPV